ncbi:NAD(P)H dehydrogenase [Kiloniella litopenaei]|uniref:NAD(P)H dehydrogenase n=1 Tax=Kiloniella litopenaei TaxID=1549748 RepID=A0A0M2RA91_9PROT|nr:NAD(P)H-dependent oxidoreductase [Kiloniella litopenaei]KKJ78732.1 NAD(P)H dehydrogenase [Kiloniella litopenaei]
MKCLVVIAHPLEDSLCKHLAKETIAHLKAKGYEIKVKDLYAENFAPALSPAERQSYFTENFDSSALELDLAQLKETQSLVLIFPTWWFSFPAILKGWFDRVWAPGHAYDHADNNKAILPKLDNLIEMKVITTLGSPRWVDLLVLRQPVRRVLKTAIRGTCAPKCRFQMLSLYDSESLSKEKVDRFIGKIRKQF